jgi:Holliday junction resolvase-like predicted endonuclease
MARALSEQLFHDLNPEEGGKYGELVKRVRGDKDLDLEFRGDYIDVYFQGHMILNLTQEGVINIDEAFTEDGLHRLPKKIADIQSYIENLPFLKDNISRHSKENKQAKTVTKKNRELEFEQLLIRANNRESSYNPDYIILDRQYRLPTGRRIDLIALRYSSRGKPTGYLSIIEVKYAQNPDIKDIKSQIGDYARHLKDNIAAMSHDMEKVLRQKLELQLISRTPERLRWLKNDAFRIDRDIRSTEILVYLIDYNPKSKLISRMEEPSFPGKIRYAYGGLALWYSRFRSFKDFVSDS